MRLIDADALQKALAKKWYESPKRLSGIKVSMLIDEQPTIEPKRGRWIEDTKRSAKHIEKIYVCSNCHNFEAWGETEMYKFCPNCGAKMYDPCEDCQEFSCDYCPNRRARME